jgi:acetolactate synthase-1/2/3 large subunit
VPADVAWSEAGTVAALADLQKPKLPATTTIARAATALRSGSPTAILLFGNALYGKGLLAAGRIAAATGAKLFAPYPLPHLRRSSGIPTVDCVPYVLE